MEYTYEQKITLFLKILELQKYFTLHKTLYTRPYIYDNFYCERDTTSKLKEIRNIIQKAPEDYKNLTEALDKYEPDKTEELFQWFSDDTFKSPGERYDLEALNYGTSSKLLKSINENKFVQNFLYIYRIFATPLYVSVLLFLTNSIVIYFLFLWKHQIQFKIPQFLSILKQTLFIKNNFYMLVFRTAEKIRYLLTLLIVFSIFQLIDHVVKVSKFYNQLKSIYKKNAEFSNTLHQLDNLLNDFERLDKFLIDRKTLDYFKNALGKIYQNQNKTDDTTTPNIRFFIQHAGTIISDFYIISNKKQKLKKLMKLNGKIDYFKIINN
jgi:hypothetical protein